jgi:hypothetical protein
MGNRFGVSGFVLVAGLMFSLALGAQEAATPQANQKWNTDVVQERSFYVGKKSAPAPRRDLSGVWDGTAENGGAYQGAREMPEDGKPEHELPFTPLGRETLLTDKPGVGVRGVSAAVSNDPVNICDPQGFPRMVLYELRIMELVQTEDQVIYLDQFNDNWRVIWTDGRELPKNPEPRWNGYSVGKWVDDYTFVVDTVGMDERTWLDNAGRPHSSELKVREVYHRLNHDVLELTVTIDDPKMYTKPWVAINKIPLHLQAPDFDIREFFCVPSETMEYNKTIGEPVSKGGDWRGK